MDVSKLIIDGEWLELETVNDQFGTLKVRVVPRQFAGTVSMIVNDDIIKLVNRLIVDWNLKNGEKPIPCTEENKDKYMTIIAGWGIKNSKYSKGKGTRFENVGTEIIAFAQDLKNFTKN